jgi:hypothetical protein
LTKNNKGDEIRSLTMNLRTSPSIKAAVAKLAEADHRSVTQVIELLILAETERRKPGAGTGKKKPAPR